ncbi:trace amine-associated receptor 8a-like [Erpetoichthys calabaricus]|uniref:trace amine-associated receptor 8a-like n=1 Tax=Erpetoichthys calabaricus TaxID=27687 RepID=UPI00109F27F3|nr:trace amine-associated receptor 8a-like [Erpetoichthys calabaricus]
MNSTMIIMEALEYCFENVNKSCIKASRSLGLRVILYFVFVSTVLITICGNLIVIISISHFKQLHSPNNFLVLSLATADLLLGLIVLPFSMVRMVETCWYLGPFFCRLHTCIDMLLCTASIFHLCFISIDRYYAVCDPLHYANKINTNVICLFIALAWILPAIYSLSLIYTKSNDQGLEDLVNILSCEGGCLLLFNKLWALLDAVTFFGPCFVMIAIYAYIFKVAKKQACKIQRMEEKINSLEECKSKESKRNREQKAAKTLGIVMGVFLICWVPYFTDTAVDAYVSFSTPSVVFDGLIWLGYINSAFNPLIYAFFYPWFRKALKLIVTCKIFSSNSSNIQLYSD